MKVVLIYGDPATGKTTLDLNLRNYFMGRLTLTETRYVFGERGTCFVGRTKCSGKNKALMHIGADSQRDDDWRANRRIILASAFTVVMHLTRKFNTYGQVQILSLCNLADEVQVIHLHGTIEQRIKNWHKRRAKFGKPYQMPPVCITGRKLSHISAHLLQDEIGLTTHKNFSVRDFDGPHLAYPFAVSTCGGTSSLAVENCPFDFEIIDALGEKANG